MISEDISDLVKGSVAFGFPTATFMGVPLQDWMYYVSIFAALLLIFERLPAAYKNITELKEWGVQKGRALYARIKK